QVIGITNSMEVMTKRYGKNGLPLLALGYKRLLSGWSNTADVVSTLSGEMRHRLDTADVDIRNAMNRYLSGATVPGLKGTAKRTYDGSIAHAYIAIRYIQTYLVDIPLWLAAHEGALAKGLEGDAAVAAADDAVITSQGAGGAKDTAMIEGNIPGVEWFTMFYSYGSAYLNRQASIGRDIGKSIDGGVSALVAALPLHMARLSFLCVLPVIMDDLFNQASGAEDGADDDESWAAYYGSRMFAYLFYGLPGIRDYANSKFGYRVSPIQSIGDAFGRLSNDIERKFVDGKNVKARKIVRDAVNVAGYSLGLPLAGPYKHIDYMWRVAEDEENPETIAEFAAAAALAKREKR
ncbi:MAG: hypothetical protein LH624_18940, partial [Cryobacterium sp.]|nr:hypothetical protein [Cryobacterium sp.]